MILSLRTTGEEEGVNDDPDDVVDVGVVGSASMDPVGENDID